MQPSLLIQVVFLILLFRLLFHKLLSAVVCFAITVWPPGWCRHLIVVSGFEYVSDPESYISGSVATGRAFLCWTGQRVGVRQREMSDTKTDAGSSLISGDLKHRANDARDGLSSYSNRLDQSGFNGSCTAMWKANGKTTTLSLFPG